MERPSSSASKAVIPESLCLWNKAERCAHAQCIRNARTRHSLVPIGNWVYKSAHSLKCLRTWQPWKHKQQLVHITSVLNTCIKVKQHFGFIIGHVHFLIMDTKQIRVMMHRDSVWFANTTHLHPPNQTIFVNLIYANNTFHCPPPILYNLISVFFLLCMFFIIILYFRRLALFLNFYVIAPPSGTVWL